MVSLMAANLDNSDKGISKDKPINTAVLAIMQRDSLKIKKAYTSAQINIFG